MKRYLYLCFIIAMPLFYGCAATPQSQINASEEFWQDDQAKVGVYVSDLPEVKGHFYGAGCLLCMATASAINSSLNSYMSTQSSEDLASLESQLIDALKDKGVNAVPVQTEFTVAQMKKFPAEKPNVAKNDFTPLKNMEGLDKVLVVDLTLLGTVRQFSNYVPVGDPYAALEGLMYIVNLDDNSYEFYEVLDIHKFANGEWDEPPNYPGITNAYYTAVELGKSNILDLSVDAPTLSELAQADAAAKENAAENP